jgi:hypothetical protein
MQARSEMLRARALVSCESPPHESVSALRPSATFLTQLLATKFDLPQTRRRRQSSASNVAAVYRDQALADDCGRPHRLCRDL